MNEKRRSPVAAVKRVLGSGKITFICVLFTVALLTSFGEVMNDRIDFGSVELFGMSLSELVGNEAAGFLRMIGDALFIVGIIGLLPKLLVTVALWMVKSGAGEGEKCNKNAILGLNLFKLNYMYKAVMNILGLTVIGVAGIFIIIATASASVNATVILIEVVALALVVGWFYFFFKYSTNFVAMLSGVTQTLRTNVNVVVKSNQVIVFNYILAIYLILSSFGNGIWALIGGILEALCIIFVNRCFAEFDNILGYARPEDSKAVIERIRTDPALEKTAIALGVGREYANDPMEQRPPITKFVMNMMFGLSVAYIDDQIPTEVEQGGTVNVTADPMAATAGSSGIAPTVGYVNGDGVKNELGFRLLPLFENDGEIGGGRYSVLGDQSFDRCDDPIELRRTQVVKDSISEKRILRLFLENTVPAEVKKVALTLIPATNDGTPLGIMKNVTYECNAAKGDGFGGGYGLVLPDNATCGSVQVTYVEFGDGLFRDKAGEKRYFVTDEKADYDKRLAEARVSAQYIPEETEERRSDADGQPKPDEKSRLPLTLALSALGGFILTFIMYAVANWNLGQIGPSYVYTFQHIVRLCLFLWIACTAVALTAVAVRKKNRATSVAVVLLSSAVVIANMWITFNAVVWLFVLSTLTLALVFGIIAAVKKDRGFIIGIVFTLAVILLIFAVNVLNIGACSLGKSNRPDDYEGTGSNTPATTAPMSATTAPMHMELEFTGYGDGTCYVSGFYWYSGSNVEPFEYFDNDTGTLTIPECSPNGDSVRIIGLDVFSYEGTIKKVIIPNTVKRIAARAFENCNSITSVVFLGTQAEWDAINIEEGNEILNEVHREFFDGVITPVSTTSGQ